MPEQWRRAVYASGGWEIDLVRRELRAHGLPLPLGARAFEIVEVLVQARGELVNKYDLMARVWPGAIVEENTLQFHICAIRKALGADRGLLKTVSGRGYRLLGSWSVQQDKLADRVDIAPPRKRGQPFRTNVPIAASALIGRSTAKKQLLDVLSAYRVVTLTGPGGIGKTVLALEVARGLFGSFEGDCWLVALAPLSDPDLLPSAVAGVLGLKVGGDKISVEAVARGIGGDKLLIILDNCEHIIGAAAELAETLVRMCPNVSVLATSRENLRIDGEYVYRVPPLAVPPQQSVDAGKAQAYSAVQLFFARMSSADANVSLDPENVATIAVICRQLDGIPLAIEFAATRSVALGPQQVAARLHDRFRLLTVGRRTSLARHRTLLATLDWSYQLLPESEQCLLRGLGIFVGGFTLEAATAVTSAANTTTSTVAERLASLVAKSLVSLDASVPSGRWQLLETIRAYALDKLAENGEVQEMARRHAGFFRDLFAPAESASQLPTIVELGRRGREIDNVRAAIDWSLSTAEDSGIGVVLTAAYAPVWLHLALMKCRERCERAVDRLEPGMQPYLRLRLQLSIALGVALVFTMGMVEETKIVLTEALDLAESLNDEEAELRALWAQWALQYNVGEARAAQSTAERFLRVARRSTDPTVVLVGDRFMGATLQYQGKQREARRYFERVLELYVAPTDQRHTILFHYDQPALARAMLARVLWLEGLIDQAVDLAERSLKEARASAHELSVLYPLAWTIFPITLMTGDLGAAEHALDVLIEVATAHNATWWQILGSCLRGKLLIKRGEFTVGLAELRSGLNVCDKTGWTLCYPEFLGALAEGLAGLGQLSQGLQVVDQALASADRGGERWYVAELLRCKGEWLLQASGDQSNLAAEDCLKKALAVAREQGALFWELRAAMSVARLRTKQNRHDDGRRVLTSVYDRFTEGFDTEDLRSAAAMLKGPLLTASH